jgi:hypothetical protein
LDASHIRSLAGACLSATCGLCRLVFHRACIGDAWVSIVEAHLTLQCQRMSTLYTKLDVNSALGHSRIFHRQCPSDNKHQNAVAKPKLTCLPFPNNHHALTSRLSRRRLSSNIPSLSFSPSSPSSSTSSSSSASGTPIHSLGTTQGTLTPTPAALFSHPGALLPVNSRQSSLVKWLQFLLNRSYSRPMNFAAVR